ncbi:hypothetical protein A4X13_0g8801 [Tilletia indica]|uniref:Uncharacterized protein n=1 Tax=Tilletia indica TaxID=43049 RepID=A0A177T1W1_9BASI|nr:hypothetical protein A4X13_0g8801 [Tilletia indica]
MFTVLDLQPLDLQPLDHTAKPSPIILHPLLAAHDLDDLSLPLSFPVNDQALLHVQDAYPIIFCNRGSCDVQHQGRAVTKSPRRIHTGDKLSIVSSHAPTSVSATYVIQVAYFSFTPNLRHEVAVTMQRLASAAQLAFEMETSPQFPLLLPLEGKLPSPAPTGTNWTGVHDLIKDVRNGSLQSAIRRQGLQEHRPCTSSSPPNCDLSSVPCPVSRTYAQIVAGAASPEPSSVSPLPALTPLSAESVNSSTSSLPSSCPPSSSTPGFPSTNPPSSTPLPPPPTRDRPAVGSLSSAPVRSSLSATVPSTTPSGHSPVPQPTSPPSAAQDYRTRTNDHSRCLLRYTGPLSAPPVQHHCHRDEAGLVRRGNPMLSTSSADLALERVRDALLSTVMERLGRSKGAYGIASSHQPFSRDSDGRSERSALRRVPSRPGPAPVSVVRAAAAHRDAVRSAAGRASFSISASLPPTSSATLPTPPLMPVAHDQLSAPRSSVSAAAPQHFLSFQQPPHLPHALSHHFMPPILPFHLSRLLSAWTSFQQLLCGLPSPSMPRPFVLPLSPASSFPQIPHPLSIRMI